MPITHGVEFRRIAEQEFHKLNYEIMGRVFSVHNSLGRLCDEKIYQREIASILPTSLFLPVVLCCRPDSVVAIRSTRF